MWEHGDVVVSLPSIGPLSSSDVDSKLVEVPEQHPPALKVGDSAVGGAEPAVKSGRRRLFGLLARKSRVARARRCLN